MAGIGIAPHAMFHTITPLTITGLVVITATIAGSIGITIGITADGIADIADGIADIADGIADILCIAKWSVSNPKSQPLG